MSAVGPRAYYPDELRDQQKEFIASLNAKPDYSDEIAKKIVDVINAFKKTYI